MRLKRFLTFLKFSSVMYVGCIIVSLSVCLLYWPFCGSFSLTLFMIVFGVVALPVLVTDISEYLNYDDIPPMINNMTKEEYVENYINKYIENLKKKVI